MRYAKRERHIIYQQLRRQKKKEVDLCRLLGITCNTLHNWIEKPSLITLGDVILMAGFLKLDYEFLIFYLLRSKSKGKRITGREEAVYINEVKGKNERFKFID